jgi:hypothetical protein
MKVIQTHAVMLFILVFNSLSALAMVDDSCANVSPGSYICSLNYEWRDFSYEQVSVLELLKKPISTMTNKDWKETLRLYEELGRPDGSEVTENFYAQLWPAIFALLNGHKHEQSRGIELGMRAYKNIWWIPDEYGIKNTQHINKELFQTFLENINRNNFCGIMLLAVAVVRERSDNFSFFKHIADYCLDPTHHLLVAESIYYALQYKTIVQAAQTSYQNELAYYELVSKLMIIDKRAHHLIELITIRSPEAKAARDAIKNSNKKHNCIIF